jgi:hypothetical protein
MIRVFALTLNFGLNNKNRDSVLNLFLGNISLFKASTFLDYIQFMIT